MSMKDSKQAALVTGTENELVHVLIADSHRMNTQLLAQALNKDKRFHVVGQVNSLSELYSRMDSAIHVLLIGIDLEGCQGGLRAVRHLRSSHPGSRAILLADTLQQDLVVEAFRSGARGVFGRSEDLGLLFKCIYCVYLGQIWAGTKELEFLLESLVDSAPPRFVNSEGMSLLSDRERNVVQLVAEGLTNRAVAEKMGISEHTVKNHLFRIYAKLGVSTRLDVMFSVLSQRPKSQAAQILLERSEEDTPNEAATFQFYMNQADRYPLAQYAVGAMYLTGKGVRQDLVTGYMWLLLAEKTAANIIAKSRDMRKEFAKQIRAEGCRKAESLAAQHLEKQIPQIAIDPGKFAPGLAESTHPKTLAARF
jgi:two-component system nitrate/nitrite response regulator NarL